MEITFCGTLFSLYFLSFCTVAEIKDYFKKKKRKKEQERKTQTLLKPFYFCVLTNFQAQLHPNYNVQFLS